MSNISVLNQTNQASPVVDITPLKDVKISSTKRKHINLSPPENSPNAKKGPYEMPNSLPADPNKPVTYNDLVALLSEQTNSLTNSLINELAAVRKEINDKIDEKLAHITNEIEAVKSNVQGQLDEMKNEIAKQQNMNDDDYLRFAKSSELKIKGIEHTTNENLYNVVGAIANAVNFDLNNPYNIPSVDRPYKYNPMTKTRAPAPVIILKFIANHIRDEFYSQYLSKFAGKQQFMTEHIGLPPGGRIIVGESLTQSNYAIFNIASKFKRENKISQVFTKNGLVQIKINKTDRPAVIRSIRQLELIIHQANNAPSASIPPVTTMHSVATPSSTQHTSSMESNDNINQGTLNQS